MSQINFSGKLVS